MYKRYHRIITVLLVILCVWMTCGARSVYAADTKTQLETAEAETEHAVVMTRSGKQQERTVRIGYIDYSGFITQREDGTYEGYGVEYLREISEYTGWKYEYIYDSWENQLQNLQDGKIDFICHAQKTPEREADYLFSKYSIGAESSVLYVRRDEDRYYYNDFERFDGMRIAVLADSFQNAEFQEYASKKDFEFQFVEYETQEKCFEALDEKQVDAVATGSLAVTPKYNVICRFGSDPFYFMTGKQNEELLEDLDDALGQITAAGSSFQSELYQKYYGEIMAEQEVILTREEALYIAEEHTVKIALIPSRKPFSYVDEEDEFAGITVDVMNLLSKKSGLKFEFEMMPRGMRATDYLAENPEAFIAGIMVENPAFHTESYIVSDSFCSDDVALACLKGKDYDMDTFDQIYKLAIPKSYAALQEFIKQNYPQFEIILCQSTEECLKMVLDEEVDFAAQNVNVLTPYLANPHYEKITVIPTFFMEESMGIVSLNSEENRIVTNILNRCIASVTQKDLAQFTVDHTVANGYRLTSKDMCYRFRYPLFAIGVLIFLVIMLMFAFIMLRRKHYRRLEEKNLQLREAVAQADNANRAKSQFLANMSHEIRTPMNAIVGLTELARHRKNNPDQVEEYLDKIETSSKVLLNIVNDVLDMSAIENDKIKIAKNPFLLRDILDSISAVYMVQCRQKGITFALDMQEIPEGYVKGDGLRLNQVLLNLISNAYKFTPEGGTITVTVQEVQRYEGNAYYKFMVSDTGEGMSQEMLGRLFLPFEQEEADTAQKHGGSGLGLSIAKNLTILMGGEISCQSEKGLGTTFTVIIPFEEDEDEPITPMEMDLASVVPEKEVYDFGGKKILLAEDTEINANIVEELLELVNMKVEHAWNGEEAVKMFAASEPGTYEAILMDVQMPVMNGYEAAKAIRGLTHPQAEAVKIYAMTANAFTEDVSAALNSGMNGHIAKPIDTELLYQTLYQAVEANKSSANEHPEDRMEQ